MDNKKIIGKIYPLLEFTGPIGSIVSSYIADFLSEQEFNQVNKRIALLEAELKDFNVFKYKIINRLKIKNFLVRALLEEKEDYFHIAQQVLKEDEELFEDIIDELLKIDATSLEVLYRNYWKKSKMKEFQHQYIQKLIEQEYETRPDLIFNYGYRVNKELENKPKNITSLISGTAMNNEVEELEKPMQKLQNAGLLRYYIYYPNINSDFFSRYQCINFSIAGKKVCELLEKTDRINDKVLMEKNNK